VQLNGGFLEEKELNEKNRPCTEGTSGSMSPPKTRKEDLKRRTLISIGAVGILVIIGILVSLPPAFVQSAPATSGVLLASDLNPYQESKTFNWESCGFAGNQACEIAFSAMPAVLASTTVGKAAVIHVHGIV